MKVLLSWLREFAPFEGDPVALGDQMSDLGMAVESIEHLGAKFSGVVVAKVLELRKHPDADRIQLVDVDAGDGQPLQIVCGAKNLSVGDLVPLATIGAELPGGFRIEKRKMRGEVSNGMLCSSRELGFGDDHEGILLLGRQLDESALGTDLREALELGDDVLYDLEINPNRPDAMSVAGVARDLAARLHLPFAIAAPQVSEQGEPATGRVQVELLDPDLCGRFVARVLDGVTVGISPEWIARRLTLLGMRPINSVVDVSNYVMLELGQPNHTYDLAKVPGGHLRVRWARDGERIVTLDGVERTLTTGDGVIADGSDTPIGIAGVMGGASTEISDTTTAVLLEMAWWDPMTIAKSSVRLGLRSEASMRFERGADPELAELAARRFAELLAPCGATLAPGIEDRRGDLPSRGPVRVRTERVNEYLGTAIEGQQIRELLTPIGFDVTPVSEVGGGVFDVRIPSFRPDTATEVDIIEEVARHYGYGNIAPRVPGGVRTGGLSHRQADRRLVRQTFVGLGLSEAMPLPFLAPGDLEQAGLDERAVSVTNPLVAEESVLRTSLRPGLLKAIAYNERHRSRGVGLFEIGKVFLPPPAGQQLPHEPEVLGAALAGGDGRDAVELWHVVADALGFEEWSLEQVPVPGLHPTRCGELLVNGEVVGALGELDPDVATRFGIDERVAWLEVDLTALLDLPHTDRHYRQVSRFPSSDVDLAFEVPEAVPAAAIERAVVEAAGPLLGRIELFDVYRGPGVPEGHRSLAFRLRFQAPDRTLTDAEVGELRAATIGAVEAALPVRLRG